MILKIRIMKTLPTLSLLASIVLSVLSPLALAAVPAAPPGVSAVDAEPVMKRQHTRPAEFMLAQQKAMVDGGSIVSEDFIKQWFGAGTVADKKTPIFDVPDTNTPYTLSYVNDNGTWRKEKILSTPPADPSFVPAHQIIKPMADPTKPRAPQTPHLKQKNKLN